VAIRLPAAPAGDVLAQVFVTDQVDVEGDGATAPRELVVLLRGSEVSVVAPSGRVSGQSLVVAEGQRDLRVRMMLNRTETIVVAGDQRLYAGLHELDPRAARHIGVRLLSRQARPADGPSVQSIRLKTPRGPDDPGMEVRE
jgi:hypothetical protein